MMLSSRPSQRSLESLKDTAHLASTVMVKAVFIASSFSSVGTMSGKSSRSRSAAGIAVQMMPVVCSTMNAMACGVTYTPASCVSGRSPSRVKAQVSLVHLGNPQSEAQHAGPFRIACKETYDQ